ncbi:unnamed protein product [Vitrella brassicaformis CCMP3155]|uniref:Uncharacterized protein n=2 Tax=Vitrella brassicaformis TaxID=1169539 RepID=A0A0G4F1H5_VITBC|nr:unnamed protein product [Vitrella brassicaformis CCMP3155]|eukprot:CEM05578.1 unnamed protein product [Vitrella brassicaformis CCMP3155]
MQCNRSLRLPPGTHPSTRALATGIEKATITAAEAQRLIQRDGADCRVLVLGDQSLVQLAISHHRRNRHTPGVIRALLEGGADVNRNHPLRAAFTAGRWDIIAVLLVHKPSLDGFHLCEVAASAHGGLEKLRRVKMFADSSDRGRIVGVVDDRGKQAIHSFTEHPLEDGVMQMALLRMLRRAAGPEILSARDGDGNLPLHYASDVATIAWMCREGDKDNVNAKNSDGHTPLKLAALSGHTQRLPALIEHGASPYRAGVVPPESRVRVSAVRREKAARERERERAAREAEAARVELQDYYGPLERIFIEMETRLEEVHVEDRTQWSGWQRDIMQAYRRYVTTTLPQQIVFNTVNMALRLIRTIMASISQKIPIASRPGEHITLPPDALQIIHKALSPPAPPSIPIAASLLYQRINAAVRCYCLVAARMIREGGRGRVVGLRCFTCHKGGGGDEDVKVATAGRRYSLCDVLYRACMEEAERYGFAAYWVREYECPACGRADLESGRFEWGQLCVVNGGKFVNMGLR